jgi:hypothetical protein
MNKLTGTYYVKDAIGQFVPQNIVRAITHADKYFIKIGEGILPKSDPAYQKKFPRDPGDVTGRTPVDHAAGAKISPFSSFTKQPDGNVKNPHNEPFDKGLGKVRVDLSFLAQKNISDVSTRAGQDFWSFSNPKATTKGRVQALKDVVRTSEVMIRGRIPGEAIEPL